MKTMPTMTPSGLLSAASELMATDMSLRTLLAKQGPPLGDVLLRKRSIVIRQTELLLKLISEGQWFEALYIARDLERHFGVLRLLAVKQYELSQSQPLSKQAKSDSRETSAT